MLALSEGSSPVTAQGGLCFCRDGLRYLAVVKTLADASAKKPKSLRASPLRERWTSDQFVAFLVYSNGSVPLGAAPEALRAL